MNGIMMRMLTQKHEEYEERPEERRRETENRKRMREEPWQEPERWPEPEMRRTMAYSYPMRSTEPMRRSAEPEHTMPRAGLYDGGGMGFGAVAHYEDGQRQEGRPAIRATGTVWMNQPEEADDEMGMDRETAERWVQGMEGTDPNRPRGGKWSAEALKPLAKKNGFPTEGPEFWAFYAMANAMYSDYAATAKRYGISTPEFYAELARDFIHDADAEPDKVARYYKYIARK